jgi:serine acetyltransferase
LIKRAILSCLMLERFVRLHIRASTAIHDRVPLLGRWLSLIFDRALLTLCGIDLTSHRIRVATLSISHPAGVLLGGNGIVSAGRVAIMSGVKFVGSQPDDPEYLARAAVGDVFRLGDNVVIGANSVIIGPIDICDNVVIGAMSLVNRSITEPGTYVGVPVRRIRTETPGDQWFAHMRDG